MLALIYLGLAIVLGDILCRRFYRFVSVQHRYAAAILSGTLLATWFTYLFALVFSRTAEPLLWANLLFFVAVTGAISWLSKKSPEVQMIEPRSSGLAAWDWITLGVLSIAACVLLIGMLYVDKQGRINVSGIEASDFALQSTIAQSFALGRNFPPESPYYAGQPLHYDFLFYFQAGNLGFLGLNPAWSVDLLSVLGFTSMLALVMVLGELLFNSRVVGRVGAVLVFFPGSLAFISSLNPQGTGAWTPIIFITQRHLPTAIGIFLLLIIFLVDQYRQTRPQLEVIGNQSAGAFIFSGALLGALPLWNGPVFIATATMLLLLLILFPYRSQIMILGITAAAVALPRFLLSRHGDIAFRQQHLFSPGALADTSIVTRIVDYFGMPFGAKWLAIILALLVVARFQRRFFFALCSLFIVALCMKPDTGTLESLSVLNVWSVVANLFAAYGLWWLWKFRTVPVLGPLAAMTLATCIVAGGIGDLFAIRNSSYVQVNYQRDDLRTWLVKETNPEDVFLTDRFLSHPILLAGRQVFLGSQDSLAGYDPVKREPIYRQMFQSKNPRQVFDLLKENHVRYIAIDDGVRNGDLGRNLNEYLYRNYFHEVYRDKENRYHGLVIYKVPESVPESLVNMNLAEPTINAFQGGKGTREGQFTNPRGLAIDTVGNIVVADTDNERIEKFSPNGVFITNIGGKVAGHGQLVAPNGIAIDRSGLIYVTEAAPTHCVRKLAPDGTFIAEWKGPDSGFYGPRRIAIGPDNSIYVVDQGRNRVVKFDPDGKVLAIWGKDGSNDGQFRDPTSVVVDPTSNKVYVADPINRRIQVFDSDGQFLTKWPVLEWGEPTGFEDLAIDAQGGRLYASSAHANTIAVFDLQGNRVANLTPAPPDKLDGPTALALEEDKLFILNSAPPRVSLIVLPNR